MRLTQRSLLPRAILCACRTYLEMILTVGLLAFPAALGAQTLTYLGQQSTITYNQGEEVPQALAVDSAGNLYVADILSGSIIRIAVDGTQTNVGSGLNNANGVAVDAAGNVYVTTGGGESGSVVKIAANGTQTNISITGLQGPYGVAVDSSGNLYVADEMGPSVYEVFAAGGQATIGSEIYGADGVAVDPAGNVYVSTGAGPIYKITSEGVQTEIVSDSYFTFGVSVDAHGNVFYSNDNDEYSNGDVYELEGSTPVGFGVGTSLGTAIGSQGNLYGIRYGGGIAKINLGAADFGSANVCPAAATTPSPCTQSLTLNFVVPATQISVEFADTSASVTTNGVQNLDFTITSNTCTGISSGNSSCAVTLQFRPLASGVRSGALDILGTLNGGPQGSLATVQVHGLGLAPLVSFDSELISTLPISLLPEVFIAGVTPDGAGNLYIADGNRCVIEKFTAATNVLSTIAGTGTCGSPETSNGVLATTATFASVWKPAVDGRGNVYFSDVSSSVIWKVDALNGYASILAGTLQTPGQSGDGGLAANALLDRPYSIASDGAGDLYVTDYRSNTVRRIDGLTSVISTVAGNYPGGLSGSTGDGGSATGALLQSPDDVVLDSIGNVYIADTGNNAIRKVDAVTGIISTVAGQLPPATYGYAGDGGLATASLLDSPEAVAVDSAGNLYIADSSNLVVRKVNSATGDISTIAGVFHGPFDGQNGSYTGDGGVAALGTFAYLLDISVDSAGNLYLDDFLNAVIRKITAASGKLAFGSSPVGVASTYQNVTVANNGNVPLNLFSLSLPENFVPDEARFDCSEESPIAPGGVCSLSFDFLPTTNGLLSGVAMLSDNDPSLVQSFSLSGTGTSLAVASKLALNGVPSTVAFGGNLGTITVSIETSSGVVFTSSTAAVVLTITGPGFSYAATVSASSGTASFPISAVVFRTPGIYTIAASSSGLTSATGSFTVNGAPPLAAAKLALDGPDTTLPDGENLGAVLVSVETSDGVTVGTSTASVTLLITGPNGFSRTVSATAIAGIAAFDLVTITFNSSGTYTITASSEGLASATATFIVEPAPPMPARLAFSRIPADVAQGDNLGRVSVSVESSGGAVITDSEDNITITITGPNGYTKTSTEAASSGVAVFNLSLDSLAVAGTYTITATSQGLLSAVASFIVDQGFTVGPSGGTSGSDSSQTVIPGAPAVYQLTLAPAGSVYTFPITLTATGLPPGATYTFLPDVVTPGSAAATSKLTIQTAKIEGAVHWPQNRSAGMGEIALALLLLPFAASRKLRKTARQLPPLCLLPAVLSLGTIAGLTGCAAGGLFSFAPTKYTITVVGTSGSVVHTTTVTLIEQ